LLSILDEWSRPDLDYDSRAIDATWLAGLRRAELVESRKKTGDGRAFFVSGLGAWGLGLGAWVLVFRF
jgi:hypothetical protein